MSAFVVFPDLDSLQRAVVEEVHAASSQKIRRRFCTRFLLVSSFVQWNKLVRWLRESIYPQELRLSAFTKGDTMPRLDAWKTGPFDNRPAMLLPLMEALRFRSQENILTALASVATFPGDIGKPSPTRLYVPLLCAPEILEHCLHQRCDRFRQGQLDQIWALPQDEHVLSVVVASEFPHDLTGITDSFPTYLSLWEEAAVPNSCFVRTSIASWTPHKEDAVVSVCGSLRAVVQRLFSLSDLVDLVDAAPDALWQGILAHGRLSDTCLQDVATRLLNRRSFHPADAAATLHDLDADSKESAVLWAALQAWSRTASGLLAKACRSVEAPRRLGEALYEAALKGEPKPGDLKERRELLRRMPHVRPPVGFLEELRALPPRRRLEILTDASQEEQTLAVETAGELLVSGHSLSALRLWLQDIFPLLASYLTPLEDDPDLRDYFQRFAEARLRNEVTDELRAHQRKLLEQRPDIPHSISPRANMLRATAAPIRWLDGFGLEWHGVAQAAARAAGVRYAMKPARATLPTTTAKNKGWASNDEKTSTLDSLGHAGDYTFPESFLKQLRAVEEFINDMAGQLRHGAFDDGTKSLVLTGDHGLTPVVFHKETIPVPSGFDIVNGRALIRKEQEVAFPENLATEGDHCYIRNLGRFAGGQTKGTIHGGATLEEVLVPVITLTLDSCCDAFQPPTLLRTPTQVIMSPLGETILEVVLSRPADDILLEWDGRLFQPDEIQEAVAVFRLRDVPPGNPSFVLYADQYRLGAFTVQLLAGLELNDMGI